MKFIQIASKIMNNLRGGFQTDDNKIDWELIYDEIHKVRAEIMYQDFQAQRKVDSSFYQVVRCLTGTCRPIKCKDKFGEEIDSGDSEWVVPLPKFAQWNGEALIKYFGTTDLLNPFNQKDVLGAAFAGDDMYGKKPTIYQRIGDEAIVTNPPSCGLQFVGLIAVLDNPWEYKCNDDILEAEYPLPNRLVSHVEALCISNLSPILGIDPETPNNAKDELFAAGQANNRRR